MLKIQENAGPQDATLQKEGQESIEYSREEAQPGNYSKIHDFSKTIGQNSLEESKIPAEITMKDPFDTDSKSPILTPDAYLSNISKKGDDILQNFYSKPSNNLVTTPVQTEITNPVASLLAPSRSELVQTEKGKFGQDQGVQVGKFDTEILEQKLKVNKASSGFDKIFVILDEIVKNVPDLATVMAGIRREVEVEIGAIEMEKQKVEQMRKEVLEKTETIMGKLRFDG